MAQKLFLVEGIRQVARQNKPVTVTSSDYAPARQDFEHMEVSPDTVLASEEIHNIAIAIGVDPDSDDLSELRYDKICILADADSDGLHIATLLCALFVKHFKAVVDAGHLYVAMPPLYRIDIGKEVEYALDNDELEQILKKVAKTKSRKLPF